MAKRGWERLVGVIDRHQVVAVFAPQTIRSHRDLSLAVLVSAGFVWSWGEAQARVGRARSTALSRATVATIACQLGCSRGYPLLIASA